MLQYENLKFGDVFHAEYQKDTKRLFIVVDAEDSLGPAPAKFHFQHVNGQWEILSSNYGEISLTEFEHRLIEKIFNDSIVKKELCQNIL